MENVEFQPETTRKIEKQFFFGIAHLHFQFSMEIFRKKNCKFAPPNFFSKLTEN